MHKDKLVYIDYLRTFAILLIVLIHTMSWGNGIILEFNKILYGSGTYIFVFISGFLFEYLAYKFNYKEYIKKKFFNVIMPYLCITSLVAIYTAFNVTDTNNPLINMPVISRIFTGIISGSILNNSLWFIPMISIFFIMAPIFLFIKKHKFLFIIILILSIIYTVYTIRPIIWESLYANSHLSFTQICLKYVIFYIKSFLFFSSSYLLGMVSCDFIEKYKTYINENIYKITGCLFIIYLINFAAYFIYKNPLEHIVPIFFFLSLAILFEQKTVSSPKPCIVANIATFLAKYSFGIFLIHQYFLNFCIWHHIYRCYYPQLIYTSGNTVYCFVLSLGIFLFSLFGSITVLYILKKILKFIGVKNIRRFIGV